MELVDELQFRIYTAKQEADKAIHSLKGILLGINFDNEVNAHEASELRQWVKDHQHFSRKNPFSEFMTLIDSLLSGDHPSKEILEDIWWLTQKYEAGNYYYNAVTTDLQILQGLCHGILSDGIVNDTEILELEKWIRNHRHLANYFPYDEINALLLTVLADKRVDEKERKVLLAYFKQFANIKDPEIARKIEEDTEGVTISGLCTTDLNITIQGRKFCITGVLKRSPRKQLERDIQSLGGFTNDSVTEDTDYLVVGDNGNPAWAFSCYGRKVEKAVEMRKRGHHIAIVHEFDFCDVIDDLL